VTGGALALILVAAATPARADEKAEARALYTDATRYYDLNDFAKALTLFRQAYLKFEDPVFIYNIGQCERQLGDKVAAVKSYRSYLRKAPEAPNREAVRKLIAQLEAAIAQESAAQHSPPEETLHPNQPSSATASTPNLTTPPSSAGSTSSGATTLTASAPEKPVYKKAWFWGVVGGVAVAAVVGVTLGVVLGNKTVDPAAPSIGVVR
jgi:tetratricopeptide (TPR) repeat protein